MTAASTAPGADPPVDGTPTAPGGPGLQAQTARVRSAIGEPATARIARVAVWSGVAMALFGYAQLFRRTYVDDTYITLQYARNLAEHRTWGFLPGVTANTATSPLNVILLALVDRLHPGSTVDAVAWLTAAEWTAMLAVLLRLSRRLTTAPHAGLLAFVGLATNPLLVSAIGLEGYLYTLLLLASLACFVERRWALLGATLGLLMLTRPDGALLALLLVALGGGGWRPRGRVVLALALTTLPWYLFSWVRLGSVLPDTLIIKLNQSAWGATTFADGFALYRDRFGPATAASLWPALLMPLAWPALRRMDATGRRAVGALAAYGALHFAAYSLMGVPPFHWYYTHQVVPIVVIGGLGGGELLRRLAALPHRAFRQAAIAATLLPALGLAFLAVAAGWRADAAPITTNWATPERYRAIGLALKSLVSPDAVIDLRGEIGTVAYYCECRVVDAFADPTRTDALIADLRADASGPMARLLDLNFTWRTSKEALPPPTRVLDFNPIDPGESLPSPGPDVLASWTVSSPWVPLSQVSLRGLTLLTVEVRLLGGDGSPLPPNQQPEMSGGYQIYTVAGGPERGTIATGTFTASRTDPIPVPPFTDLMVQVDNAVYGAGKLAIVVTGIGAADVVVGITVGMPAAP